MGAGQVPRRPLEQNEVGDLVLRDAAALRAVAAPGRLDLFDAVRRREPLGPDVADDLRALEEAGLIDRAPDGTWSTVGKGIFFEIPEEEGDAQVAARELTAAMIARYSDLPAKWAQDDEPRLAVDWMRAAGLFNARVALTADELRAIQEELERVLAPFTTRSDPPSDAAQVRVLAFFLPEA